MGTFKKILKWLAILVIGLFVLSFFEGQSDVTKAVIVLIGFTGYMFYEVQKRLAVIEGHLLKIRANMSEE